jgi:hypothetical protein
MSHSPESQKSAAYEQMLARAEAAKTQPQPLEHAKTQAIELGELSVDEAEKIADYLRRDLHSAAHFLSDTEKALADWMRFDLELLEDKFLTLFTGMVDHTRTELDNLAERARQATEWTSGEITTGTLQCANCGEVLAFYQPTHVPACPNCGGTLFKRMLEDESET